MEKLNLLSRIKEMYLENKNIIQYLNGLDNKGHNSLEDIMISYDFQSGRYIEAFRKEPTAKLEYCKHLAKVIDSLGSFNSILEVGVGEATTLGPLIQALFNKPKASYGFDISWSRVKYAMRFINELKIANVNLFTGDLFSTPIKDNAIDIVYTAHSIESNGGKEKEALTELYRITNKYLVLLEPSYEFATPEGKERMLSFGSVTRLYEHAKELGFNVIEYRLFDVIVNQLNPTALMVIEKNSDEVVLDPLCCPITKSSIIRSKDAFYSEESLLAYPIIENVPCLLPQNAIVATKFLD